MTSIDFLEKSLQKVAAPPDLDEVGRRMLLRMSHFRDLKKYVDL